MKNKIFNAIVVAISACIFFSFFIFNKGLGPLVNDLKTLNGIWIIVAMSLMFLFWSFEMFNLYTITKTFYTGDNLLFKCFKFEMIGQFFGAVTPFSAGSHAAQLYAMTENNIPAGIAGSILMIKFIIYQALNLVLLGIAFLFKFNYFNTRIHYFIYFCVSGAIVHIIIMIFAILFSINANIPLNILKFVFKTLRRFKFIRNADAAYKNLESELENFHKNATLITQHTKMCICSCTLTTLQTLCFLSIPYCVYRSFGLSSTDLFTFICAQIFLINFMAIIPLPGGEGGAEGGFFLIYGLFFASNTIATAIFVWRVITYYSTIAIGSVFTLALPNTRTKK